MALAFALDCGRDVGQWQVLPKEKSCHFVLCCLKCLFNVMSFVVCTVANRVTANLATHAMGKSTIDDFFINYPVILAT